MSLLSHTVIIYHRFEQMTSLCIEKDKFICIKTTTRHYLTYRSIVSIDSVSC